MTKRERAQIYRVIEMLDLRNQKQGNLDYPIHCLEKVYDNDVKRCIKEQSMSKQ